MIPSMGHQSGVLKVLTATGPQPFVVRCEPDTRVKDIVGAIAEIWGFREAARLFTLCHPAVGSDQSDPSKLLPGRLLCWNDRPCQAASGQHKGTKAASATEAEAVVQPPPLLLVRYIFGSNCSEWDLNHSVSSLTAAQIAADVAASRYPAVAEPGLYQHWTKQGQHSVVLQMAASWPSGPCLIVGPTNVLGVKAALQFGSASVYLGLNSRGFHIMTQQQYKMMLPLESVVCATPTGDVLNISFKTDEPDLLLQVSGAEAIAEAFRMHKDAGAPSSPRQQQPTANSLLSTPRSLATSSKAGGAQVPFCISSPTVERWLAESSPRESRPLASVSIQVLRSWEQTPPVLRVLLTVETASVDDRLVEARLVVEDADLANSASGSADQQEQGQALTASLKQERVKLRLNILQQPTQAEQRVKLTIAPVPSAERDLLMPLPGEEPLVRLVIRPRGERFTGGASPLKMLQMLTKGAAGAQHKLVRPVAGGFMLRDGMRAPGGNADEDPHAQLMHSLQQQRHELHQGLLAGSHLAGGFPQEVQFQGAGMRPVGPNKQPMMKGPRSVMSPSGNVQHQGQPAWPHQQFSAGMMARPPSMRPLRLTALPHQPYTLVGPPNTMQRLQQGIPRPGMAPVVVAGSMHSLQPHGMHPQQPQQQPFAPQLHQQQGPVRPAQQQMVLQPGGYMVVQPQPPQPMVQPQPPQPVMQQHPPQTLMQQQHHLSYAAFAQQPQQGQQHVTMLPSSVNGAAHNSHNVALVTADGGPLPENQLQQGLPPPPPQQQSQQQQLSGVYVMSPYGDLVPASQPVVVASSAGFQPMALQQPGPQSFAVAQQMRPPMYMQAMQPQQQHLQQQQQQSFQAHQGPPQTNQQQWLSAQSLQVVQPRQVASVGGVATPSQLDQWGISSGGFSQPQAQVAALNYQNTAAGQVQQLQSTQLPQQQQYVAVSAASVDGEQLHLRGMTDTSSLGGPGHPGDALQGQQQPQYYVTNQQQQQQIMLQASSGYIDSASMSLLQQLLPRQSSGLVTSGAMYTPNTAGAGLMTSNGPESTGGAANSLGMLQQGVVACNMPGVVGMQNPTGPSLTGLQVAQGQLGNAGVGMVSIGPMGHMMNVGGMGLPTSAGGASYGNSYDPLRPASHTMLDNSRITISNAAAVTADPPGLSYDTVASKVGAYLLPQQQQQQQQHFAFNVAGSIGGIPGLAGGLQPGLQAGLQGGLLPADGYTFAQSGVGADNGLSPPGLLPDQQYEHQQYRTDFY